MRAHITRFRQEIDSHGGVPPLGRPRGDVAVQRPVAGCIPGRRGARRRGCVLSGYRMRWIIALSCAIVAGAGAPPATAGVASSKTLATTIEAASAAVQLASFHRYASFKGRSQGKLKAVSRPKRRRHLLVGPPPLPARHFHR
jgi:hypothetical protein